jgi:ABC-type spermidine/putrescine transport system permease subunit I
MIFVLPLVVFMAIVFLIPILSVIGISFIQEGTGTVTSEYFSNFLTKPIYGRVLFQTIEIAFISTAATALIGYPIAYYMAKQPPVRRIYISLLLLLPFYTSILVKSFAFSVILGHQGLVNWVMRALFGEEAVLALLHNRLGVLIGITHDMLPFLVFPVVVSLLAQDPALHRAAEIMGASRLRTFWTVTFPLSLPGLLAGVFLVVIRAMGQYAVPALLGGRQDMMMANLVGFHINQVLDWNMAGAISVVLLAVSGVFLFALARVRGGDLLGARA